MMRKPRVKFPAFALAACLAAMGAPPVTAAPADGGGAELAARGVTKPDSRPGADRRLIRNIQARLREIGLYRGPVDGRMGPDTAAAIRAYQRQTQLPLSGLPAPNLLDHLESASAQAKRLLGRLERARRRQTDEARQALENNPATRNLLADRGLASRGNDGAASCDGGSTPACLIAEALRAVGAVSRTDYRDWVLEELAAAHAFNGDIASALRVVTRIHDPRLIMSALRAVAQVQASGGHLDQARTTAAAIPVPRLQAEAFLAIAEGQLTAKNPQDARRAVHQALRSTQRIKDSRLRIPLLATGARILSEAGDGVESDRLLDRALDLARRQARDDERAEGLGRVARAQVRMGRVDAALATVGAILGNDRYRAAAHMDAAAARARQGDFAAALKIAKRISIPRLQVIALTTVAIAEAKAGHRAGARRTLARAAKAKDAIEFGYNQSYARSRIAIAFGHMASFAEARETAERIEDRPLRARTLWNIADVERRLGNRTSASANEARAIDAAANLATGLDRSWTLCEIALAQKEAGNADGARATFGRGLSAARSIRSPWFRARALSKAAFTLVALDSERGGNDRSRRKIPVFK